MGGPRLFSAVFTQVMKSESRIVRVNIWKPALTDTALAYDVKSKLFIV